MTSSFDQSEKVYLKEILSKMSAPMYKLFIEFKFIEEMSLLGLKPVVVSLQRTSVSRFYNDNGATFIIAHQS